MSDGTPSRVTACTAVTRNRVPAARVLAKSYLEHHVGHEFTILVVDGPPPSTPKGEGYRFAGREWLEVDEDDFLRMATIYTVDELLAAVKPLLLRRVLADSEVAVYLDHEIQVLAPFGEVAELAEAHELVLTPQHLLPLPRDGRHPDEKSMMSVGAFNLGFVAVSRAAGPFLDFWATRLRQDAVIAPTEQLFTDHRWVDQVPALFPHTILRDPGCNVGYWNAHERELAEHDGVVTAGDSPLKFFAFRNYHPESPWLLTTDFPERPRLLLSANPVLRALCDGYRAALLAEGHTRVDDSTYGYAKTPDGTVLTPRLRHMVRAAWVDAERVDADIHPAERETVPPHPFGTDNGEAFLLWLGSPRTAGEAAAGMNRWAMMVWAQRPDLQAAFPRPLGDDAAAFRQWCRTFGVQEGMITPRAVPSDPVEPEVADGEFGVNVLGYLTGELGLGEMGRIVHDAIQHSGVPVAAIVEERSLRCRTDFDRPDTVGQARFPISLVCVNADQTRIVRESHPEVFHGRYRIGLWAWELEDFPEWQHDAFDLVDEVWTISEFCREAIAKHSPVPVKVIPVPVRDPGPRPVRPRVEGQPTQFLFLFDFNSTSQRKNPLGLIRAFRLAFPGRTDVKLVIKATNGKRHPHAAEQLRAAVAKDPRIELMERYLSVEEMDELYATSDCYVSLHRSEGFGLTVAEAMVRGMPVISTDYSSTPEFLDSSTGWPVPYSLTTVGADARPYHEGAVWAAPDERAAANAMREVAFDPDEADRRGKAARAHILRTRSMRAASQWMRVELEHAYQAWRAGSKSAETAAPVAERRLPEADPTDIRSPLRTAMQALHWRPDADSASRLPLAPAIRRAVLRVLNHYDAHQRTVLGTLAEGVDESVSRLVSRLDAVESAAAKTPIKIDSMTAAHLQVVQGQLDDLARIAAKSEARLDHVEAENARLRAELDDAAATVDANELAALRSEVSDRITDVQAAMSDRDGRISSAEHAASIIKRDMSALMAAARFRHAPVPSAAEVVVCEAGVLLAPQDKIILPALQAERAWEPQEAELLASLAGGGTVLDIGAHVGYHTLRLLRECPSVEGVVAVEANPVNAAMLARNIAVNLPADVADRVTVINAAAWDEDSELTLFQGESGNSGDFRVRLDGHAGVTVRAIRLDDHAAVAGANVSLIKTDLQGRDHRALRGLAKTLAAHRPHVVCEFWPEGIAELGDDPLDVLGGYRAAGYRPSPLGDDVHHSDTDLIAQAKDAQGGFLSLWLRPV
ncbi:FkbM family methyltransferase [Actinokineospora sp. HUAS TT18]|uniref:FkbM family methyltransferase n=1 Tax=Actinokineospora sp. HUAS TT18 TaxID=3447451 RepID=UPI003F51F8DF